MDFNAFLKPYRQRPFQWGECDCSLFVADWVLAVTQQDPAANLRGRYTTAIGARRALKRLGAQSLPEYVDSALAVSGLTYSRIPPALLARGDIGLLRVDGEPALGIVWGELVWVMGPTGCHPVARDVVEYGWRLPCHQS